MGVNELSMELWRQRGLLEHLLFKFEEEHLLLSAGRSRWMAHATHEIEVILARIRSSNLALSVAVAGVVAEWGLPDGTQLIEVARSAPTEAWREVLTAHLDALTTVTREIKALEVGNTALLRSALHSAQETLGMIVDPVGAYTAEGTLASTAPNHRVDAEF